MKFIIILFFVFAKKIIGQENDCQIFNMELTLGEFYQAQNNSKQNLPIIVIAFQTNVKMLILSKILSKNVF